jgi:hypothetical protein
MTERFRDRSLNSNGPKSALRYTMHVRCNVYWNSKSKRQGRKNH